MSGFEARQIVKSCRSGALGTINSRDGAPHVSLCAVAFDAIGHAVFLLSDLAEHTQNLKADPRVSFLCEQASGRGNPQSGPRVSLVGEMKQVRSAEAEALYLQMHPSAQMYANFEDFNLYRLEVVKAHFVGGFGRAQWLEGAEFLGDSAAFLNFSKNQEGVITYLNTEFPQFASICATKLLKQRGKSWQLLRIDSDGADLKGPSRTVRYPFETEVKTRQEIEEIVRNICT